MNKNNISYQLIGFIYYYGIICYDGHNIAYCKKGDFWYENNDYLQKWKLIKYQVKALYFLSLRKYEIIFHLYV